MSKETLTKALKNVIQFAGYVLTIWTLLFWISILASIIAIGQIQTDRVLVSTTIGTVFLLLAIAFGAIVSIIYKFDAKKIRITAWLIFAISMAIWLGTFFWIN